MASQDVFNASLDESYSDIYEQAEEMWFTLDTAFTKLMSSQSVEHENHIMSLILDSLKMESNACFAFLQQPSSYCSHKLYLMSFVIWITGKLYTVILWTKFRSTNQLAKDCQSLLLSHFIPTSLPLYIDLLQRHVIFAEKVISCHKEMENIGSHYVIKAFNAFWLLPPTLKNSCNVLLLKNRTESSIIIDHFIWVLESHNWYLLSQCRIILPQILLLLLDVVIYFNSSLMARAFKLAAEIIPLVILSKETLDWKLISYKISVILLKLKKQKSSIVVSESVNVLLKKINMFGGTKIEGLDSQLLELILNTIYINFIKKKRKNNCFSEMCVTVVSLMDRVPLSDEAEKIITKLSEMAPSFPLFFPIFEKHILLNVREKYDDTKKKEQLQSVAENGSRSVIHLKFCSVTWCKLSTNLRIFKGLLLKSHHENSIDMIRKYITAINMIVKLGFRVKYCLNTKYPNCDIIVFEDMGKQIIEIVKLRRDSTFELINVQSYSFLFNALMPIIHHPVCALTVLKLCFKLWKELKWSEGMENICGFSQKYLFHCLLISLISLSNHKNYKQMANCTLKSVLCNIQFSPFYRNFVQIICILILLANDIDLIEILMRHFKAMLKNKSYLEDLFLSPHSGKQLSCLLANRCVLQRVDDVEWNIKCIDCDLKSTPEICVNPRKRSIMDCYLNTVGLNYRDLILNSSPAHKLVLIEYLPRFMHHCYVLNTLFVMEQLSTILKPPLNKLHYEFLKNMNGFLISNICRINAVGIFVLMKAISSLMKHITSNNDIKWLKYILNMVIAIGQCDEEWVLLLATKVVFLLIPALACFSEDIVIEILECITARHSITLKELLARFQEDLSKVWATLLVFDVEAKRIGVEYTLDLISLVFDLSARDFLELYCTNTLVSYLTTFCEKTAVYILDRLSAIFDMPLKDLLIIYFEDTFARIYFYETKEKMKQMLKFMETYTHESIGTIIYFSFKTLICKVLAHSCNPKVIHFIVTETMHKTPTNNYETIKLLEQHVLGYLTYIDNKLVSSRTSEVTLKKCLSSLPDVIYFIGPSGVSNIRVKFLDTLRTGLPPHYKKYADLAIKAWAYFIYSVDLTLIGPFLSTVFVSLLPLIEMFPKDVTTLFYYLVVKNEKIFVSHLPELYFVPKTNIPLMHLVWETIQHSLRKTSFSYKDDIKATLKYVKNDNKELRIHALNRLCSLLKLHSKTLYEAILQNDMLDPLILEIIDCLMQNLRDSNQEVQMACAECIGELGAVDPSRIENTVKEGTPRTVCYNIKSDKFALFCITEMIKGLQNADDPIKSNTFASCIQELLKIYFGGKPDAISSFLEQFPVQLKDVLRSLMQARYRYLGSSFRDNYPETIFRSSLGETLSEWAYTWATQLITFIDPKSFSRKVFSACCPCLGIDMKTLSALLPYILLEALLTCTSQTSYTIEKEMKTVLRWHEYGVSSSFNLPDINERNLPLKDDDGSQTNFSALGLDDVKCINIIFDLLDFLYNCLSEGMKTSDMSLNAATIKSFLSRFPHQKISYLSYQQRDYTRSLQYLERELSSKSKDFCLHPLRCIYSKLNDPDGLLGVMRMFPDLQNTEDIVLSHIVSGKLEDAVIGYENLSQKYDNVEFTRGLIQCYLSMDQPFVALHVTKALYHRSSLMAPDFYNEMTEVLWKNILIDDLDYLLELLDENMKDNWCWGIDIGSIISYFCQKREDKMVLKIKEMKKHFIENLSVMCDTSHTLYRLGYSHIVKLHILNEFEKYIGAINLLPHINSRQFYELLGKSFDLRLELLPRDNHMLQQIISVRRVSLLLLRKMIADTDSNSVQVIDTEIGHTWLKSAKFARRCGNFRKAYAMLEMGEQYSPVGLFLERAKLHRAKCDTSLAVLTLEQGINQYFPDTKCLNDNMQEHKMLFAEAKLLLAKYNDENTNVNFHEGYRFYKEAVNICSWEKGFAFLAQYLFKTIHMSKGGLYDVKKVERDIQIVTAFYFGKSLQYGSQYIYQSMPCMLSLWFDYGVRLNYTDGGARKEERIITMKKFSTMIDKFVGVLPAYMFMTAFTQILSRINHPEMSCFIVIKRIIVNIITAFPQQAMWMFISVLKSKHTELAKRSDEVLNDDTIRRNKDLVKFITTFISLSELLIQLCRKQNKPSDVTVSIESQCRGLQYCIKGCPTIMIPAQKFRTISLPNYIENGKGISKLEHEPFPRSIVFLCDVKKNVQILRSLQRPKKVDFIGSDGCVYPIMCKSMDDLRLDSRLMEFNSIVNMYLRRDPFSRDRDLHIRTYSVVPLNHQSGLIEWVPNLVTYRHIVNTIYKEKNSFMPQEELKKIAPNSDAPLKEKLRTFIDKLLPRYPPVFHFWFFTNFSDPDSWYRARTSYVQTTAVMSIVGYVVGLGDRHGENILLDTTCGDIVHVDFNCLFNKGECFKIPEIVPFRLTHNMVKAMGPTGTEGSFVHSCQITNRILRSHKDELLAVITPFSYESELKRKPSATTFGPEDYTDAQAKKHIKRIDKRLNGIINTYNNQDGPALSVEGQVRCLIEEATDINNLCRMFLGWGAFY